MGRRERVRYLLLIGLRGSGFNAAQCPWSPEQLNVNPCFVARCEESTFWQRPSWSTEARVNAKLGENSTTCTQVPDEFSSPPGEP